MSSDTLKLDDLVKIKGGKRLPKGANLQEEQNEHPYIRVRDMGNKFIPRDGLEYVPDDVFPEINRYIVESGDLIISIVGTIGLVSLIDEYFHEASQTENCAKLSGLDKIDGEYLYYFLISKTGQDEIHKNTVGAVQKKLPLYGIKNIDVVWPEREKRELIVNNLSNLDQKIHLNQQTNETLEAMAQAIFKSWFVDFDPVRAKIEAASADRAPNRAAMAAIAGISLDQDWDEIEVALDQKLAQMSEAQQKQFTRTAQLFPDELVESEIGEVPKGWEISKLEDYLTLSYGKGLRKKDREEGKVPVYGSGGLTGTHDESLIEGPGIIVGRKGTVGSIYWEDRDFWPIDTVFYVEPKNEVDFSFYYYLLNTLGLDEMNTDAAVPGLNRNNAYRLQIPRFPEKIMVRFADFTADLHNMMRIKKAEKKTLENVRDTLLPKLISGEVEV